MLNKKYKIMDNTTALFIVVMMLVNMWLTFMAQGMEVNLSGGKLFCFLLGFIGSIICIFIRFAHSFYMAFQISSKIRKMGMIFYMAAWSILYVWSLWITLQSGNFSVTYHALGDYNAFQIFSVAILIAQWLGDNLFLRKERK